MTAKRKGFILLAIPVLALVLGGCVAPPPVPPPPSNLSTAAVSSQQIDLAWKDNSGVERGFYVYRRTIGSYSRIAALGPGRGQDDVRIFLEDAEEEIEILAYSIPA